MKAIRFIDKKGIEHIVNPNYIIELESRKYRDEVCYWLVLAHAEARLGGVKDIEIDEHAYFKIIEWL